MSLVTTWGYTVDGIDVLPNILETDGYNVFTANKYSGDGRSAANLRAASAAVRNFCGWHVFPSLACTFSSTFFDKRVSRIPYCIMVQLPATYVTEVSSVSIDGKDVTSYVIDPDGLLRIRYGCLQLEPWTPIVVKYQAGITLQMAAAIQELVAHRVTHALASSNGVQSEAVGGVSITYNATWTNNARATALADDNKEVLSPYRLRGVF